MLFIMVQRVSRELQTTFIALRAFVANELGKLGYTQNVRVYFDTLEFTLPKCCWRFT